jgi:hypothetical protein
MNLKTKHIIAMLRIAHLRKELLEEPITELDCRNFEELDEKKKEMITAQVMYVMNHGFANHLATYSNPIEQYIDPIKIYGEKGIYLVSEIDSENHTFFTNKKEAYTYANEAYDNWLEIYGDMD